MKKLFILFVLLAVSTIDLLPQKAGDAYALDINNIYMPLNRKGFIADVNISPSGSGGRFGGHVFLFSGGFFLSGFSNGQVWANGAASSSLVRDYQPGTVAGGPDDPNAVMYVLNSQDEDFGPSWQDWIDAVGLGADFYDGDGDGLYNPVDRNSNGVWDSNEDRPDLIGDETVWTVYSDGIPAAQRRWFTVPPYGIEIRQTVFAFASAGAIGNLLFLRYRFKYVGLGEPGEADVMEDVYFGVWDDPDLGDYTDDVVGSDVSRNAGYAYQNIPDAEYGNQPPSFMTDVLSGPIAYIPGETYIDIDGSGDYTPGVDTPLDTAFSNRGQVIGIEEFPGAKNLPISSFISYIGGDPNLRDPSNKEEARNYIQGLDRNGNTLDPCTFPYGEVRGGVDCTTVDPKFWFSGDPVTNVGWIAAINEDVRQMTNTGPFELVKDEENEIVVAYVIGQGVNPLDAITVARGIDDIAQNLFDNNFDISTGVELEDNSSLPFMYSLLQNYPNPFNPSTSIKYAISILPTGQADQFVSLKVYDILGNEVATLVNEEKTSGSYEILFDASNLPSGVYFYQLRAGTFVQTKKMLLLK